jgi:hypothetical protein
MAGLRGLRVDVSPGDAVEARCLPRNSRSSHSDDMKATDTPSSSKWSKVRFRCLRDDQRQSHGVRPEAIPPYLLRVFVPRPELHHN